MRNVKRTLLVMVAFVMTLAVAGCAATPFVLGDEVQPPYGCVQARERGHDC